MSRNRVSLLAAGVLAAAVLVALQACSNPAEPSTAASPSGAASSPAATAASSASAAAASESEEPDAKRDTETLKNDTGKTLIKSLGTKFGKHISFAVVSSKGTVVVADPNTIPFTHGFIKADIITSTFVNHDHKDSYFLQYNPDARVSEMKPESFAVKDVKVTGIAASHTGDPIDANAPTDVIYVYEVDGLRIAYFAGLDQERLTEDQLKQLGAIDIALLAFKDAPAWHVKKEASIMILNALKPRLVLPTEFDAKTAEEIRKAANVTDGGEADQLAVSREDLKAMNGTRSIFLRALLD
ncbi:MBL fold metallo-hydrolase [Cohnella caldifontis]|uniref:MBL fold metallo-hydrolase n=1 Tax=Cohnella caldifontis TaxID=3027471 RepID=UPI0023EDCFDA|nr:MBL fold metallo-hydrolase [Cohnella sp. YIM B05605]